LSGLKETLRPWFAIEQVEPLQQAINVYNPDADDPLNTELSIILQVVVETDMILFYRKLAGLVMDVELRNEVLPPRKRSP